jgi:hypothetical protein
MPREKNPTTPVKKRASRKSPIALAVETLTAEKAVPASFTDPEQRAALIAEAAYFRAERRNFAPGHETEDWLAAEAEVDAKLMKSETAPRV